MTTPSDDLPAGEGVNEASADGTDESTGGRGVSGALSAASETGRPKGEYDPAPPLDTGLPVTRTDTEGQVGPGQENEVGEG
jgi:hypothetical protein